MRRAIIRGLAWAAAGLVVLWALRLGYGYLDQPNGVVHSERTSADTSGSEHEKHNYASQKFQRKRGGDDGPSTAPAPARPGPGRGQAARARATVAVDTTASGSS